MTKNSPCARNPLGVCGVLVFALVLFPGCRSVGPRTIPPDRADYADALGSGWARQTLLNIVKMRYSEPPIFVDVNSIVSGYTIETATTGNLGFKPSGFDLFSLNGSIRYIDRPTISYTPLTGAAFMRSLLQPIPPAELLFSIQSGWNAEAIFSTGVAEINGLRNRSLSPTGEKAPADPEFLEMVDLFKELLQTGALGIRVTEKVSPDRATLLTFYDSSASEEMVRHKDRLAELLRLKPGINSFNVVFGSVSGSDNEIAIRTRSLIQIISIVASEIEVPQEHVAMGLTAASPPPSRSALAPIRSSSDEPEHAMVSVKYRDHWFWVDDQDMLAKRSFNFLMVLFILADTRVGMQGPLLTIPTQ